LPAGTCRQFAGPGSRKEEQPVSAGSGEPPTAADSGSAIEIDAGLRALFDPQSIAVIGATTNPRSVGSRPIRYLEAAGFAGPVYGVNPARAHLDRYVADIGDIGSVDLAVLLVSRERTMSVLRSCARSGVRAAIIGTAGFAEAGAEGAEAERAMTRLARESGMRLLGPNSLGIVNAPVSNFATFASLSDEATKRSEHGRIAVVSQSGAVASYLVAQLEEVGVPCRTWISTGNEADIEVADALGYLAAQPVVDLVITYIEGARDGRRLLAALTQLRRAGKVVGILKAGRSQNGERAVASHTAAIAGSDAVYDAAMRQAGAIRFGDFTEIIVAAQLMNAQPSERRGGLCVLTVSGGAGALIADEASDEGLDLPPLPAEVREALLGHLPFASFANPVDVTGQVASNPELFLTVTQAIVAVHGYSTVLIFAGPALVDRGYGEPLIRAAIDLRASSGMDVIVCGPQRPYALDLLRGKDVPLISDPVLATRMLGRLRRARAWQPAEPGVVTGLAGDHAGLTTLRDRLAQSRSTMSELMSKELLGWAGFPLPRSRTVSDEAEIAAALADLGAPVVVKGSSEAVLHKSELGLVRTGVRSETEARAAVAAIRSAGAAAGVADLTVFLEEQVRPGTEVLVSLRIEPGFGPVYAIGHGGIYAESERDLVLFIGLPAIGDFRAGLARLRMWPRLAGARGGTAADIEGLYALVRSLGWLAASGLVQEIELNPVVLRGRPEGAVILDAAIRTRSAASPS
jgi:acyl-CoA synthetase (NDP forming)